jgi:hypothetical protein
MKALPILALVALGLGACNQSGAASGTDGLAPSGGSAGSMGESYCEQPPSDQDMTQWNELCMPDR